VPSGAALEVSLGRNAFAGAAGALLGTLQPAGSTLGVYTAIPAAALEMCVAAMRPQGARTGFPPHFAVASARWSSRPVGPKGTPRSATIPIFIGGREVLTCTGCGCGGE